MRVGAPVFLSLSECLCLGSLLVRLRDLCPGSAGCLLPLTGLIADNSNTTNPRGQKHSSHPESSCENPNQKPQIQICVPPARYSSPCPTVKVKHLLALLRVCEPPFANSSSFLAVCVLRPQQFVVLLDVGQRGAAKERTVTSLQGHGRSRHLGISW